MDRCRGTIVGCLPAAGGWQLLGRCRIAVCRHCPALFFQQWQRLWHVLFRTPICLGLDSPYPIFCRQSGDRPIVPWPFRTPRRPRPFFFDSLASHAVRRGFLHLIGRADVEGEFGDGVLGIRPRQEHRRQHHADDHRGAEDQPEVDHRQRHFLPSLPEIAAQAQKASCQQQTQSAGRVNQEQLEGVLPPSQIVDGDEKLADAEQRHCGQREINDPNAGRVGTAAVLDEATPPPSVRSSCKVFACGSLGMSQFSRSARRCFSRRRPHCENGTVTLAVSRVLQHGFGRPVQPDCL